jgi:hypothetical protein
MWLTGQYRVPLDSLFPISTSPADSMLLGRILPKRGLKMVGGGDFTARN